MSREKTFEQFLEDMAERDPRYRPEAYAFLMQALSFTVSRLEAPRHVTGRELLLGIRDLALQQYGPMAKPVFDHWGVRETLDFGRMVFQLVDAGLLGRTETDRLEDFDRQYDFEDALVRDYPWGMAVDRGGA